MRRIARFLIVSVLLLSSTHLVHAASSYDAPQKSTTGTIQELNFAQNSMILSGFTYYAALDVNVEIRGTFGAFTMLQTGMKVYIVYRLISGTQRELVEIRQLPDNMTLEEA